MHLYLKLHNNYYKVLLSISFSFVGMQRERNRRKKEKTTEKWIILATLRVAQALTGALRAVLIFSPSPNKGENRGEGEVENIKIFYCAYNNGTRWLKPHWISQPLT